MSQIGQFQVIVATSAEMEIAIKRWIISLRAKPSAESTVTQYSYHMERFRRWLSERAIDRPADLDRAVVEEYVAECHEVWAASSVRQAVAAMRSFVLWASGSEWIKKKQGKKLLKALKLPRRPKNVQRTLSIEEIEILIAHCDPATPKGCRDRALIGLLLDSGLRSAEIRRLRVDAIEFGVRLAPTVVVNRVVVVVKGGARKLGFFGSRTADYMREWLAIRDALARPGVTSLFISLGGNTPGRALTKDGLKAILRRLGEKAGIKGVSPHPFRRSFACLLDLAGASTHTVKELGRWESEEMVHLYQAGLRSALQYPEFSPMDYLDKLNNPPE